MKRIHPMDTITKCICICSRQLHTQRSAHRHSHSHSHSSTHRPSPSYRSTSTLLNYLNHLCNNHAAHYLPSHSHSSLHHPSYRFYSAVAADDDDMHDTDRLSDSVEDDIDAKYHSSKKNNHKQSMSPSELVRELNRYIVGQNDAKRAVAIALRNRWRRHQLDPDIRTEVTPKNMLLIGYVMLLCLLCC
jgi:hypothetical protein